MSTASLPSLVEAVVEVEVVVRLVGGARRLSWRQAAWMQAGRRRRHVGDRKASKTLETQHANVRYEKTGSTTLEMRMSGGWTRGARVEPRA